MQAWEETDSLLSTAFKNYLISCSNLEAACIQEKEGPIYLPSRIDSALDSLSEQFTQSRAILLRTRNRIAPPLRSLPGEILTHILLDSVFAPTDDGRTTHLEMEPAIETIYERLDALSRVCRLWRNVIVNYKAFWSVTPYLEDYTGPSDPECLVTKLSLQRGGDSLRLAAFRAHPWDTPTSAEVLAEHAHRFCSANIRGESSLDLRNVLAIFFSSRDPLTLSELSVCQTPRGCQRAVQDIGLGTNIPDVSEYIIHKQSPLHGPFTKVLQSLSIFRVSGASINWDMTTFSNRLTELHLHRVNLGYNPKLYDFLQAASSASELRDLKIIAILSIADGTLPTSYPALSFPKLQSLLLENLDYNVMAVVLHSIPPGSHHLTLLLEHNCMSFREDEDTEKHVKIGDLCRLFEKSVIRTLMLKGSLTSSPSAIQNLLYSMPELKALMITNWHFERETWDALVRPDPELSASFPNLEELHLCPVRFSEIDRIKAVVESHPVRKVVIGAHVSTRYEFMGPELEDVRPDIVEWLRAVVPEVRLNPSKHVLPKYKQCWWRSW